MACCGGSAPATQSKAAATQTLPYKHLFKYIIVGDTGSFYLNSSNIHECIHSMLKRASRVAIALSGELSLSLISRQLLESLACFSSSPTSVSNQYMTSQSA
jgi:hypothetical protein